MVTIKKVVDWMIQTGCENTLYGSWIIAPEEIQNYFGVPVEQVRAMTQEICDEIDSREEILSETWIEGDGSFNMNFCLSAARLEEEVM